MGRPLKAREPPYRDDPHSNTKPPSSSSSLLLLNHIDYNDSPDDHHDGNDHDGTLPAYEDLPHITTSSTSTNSIYTHPSPFLLPNKIPNSHLSRDKTTTSVILTPSLLDSLVRREMKHPPRVHLQLTGTHYETHRRTNKKSERRLITDFDIKLDLTHLFVCRIPWHREDPSLCYFATAENPLACRFVKCLAPEEKGYRGGIFPSRTPEPTSSDPEHGIARDEVEAWVQSFVSSHHTVRSFVLKKSILDLDTQAMEKALLELVKGTNYRGFTRVTFPVTYKNTVVLSDCWVNRARMNWWVCWAFYLTFLWILSWPVIFLMERKWKPISMLFPFSYLEEDPTRPKASRRPTGSAASTPPKPRKPLVMSESTFLRDWQLAVKRAVVSKHQGWIDEVYRAETEDMSGRHDPRMFGDVFTQSVLAAQAVMGWGADSD